MKGEEGDGSAPSYAGSTLTAGAEDGAASSRGASGASEQSFWVKAKSSYAASSRAVSRVGVMSHEGVMIPCGSPGVLVGVLIVFWSKVS